MGLKRRSCFLGTAVVQTGTRRRRSGQLRSQDLQGHHALQHLVEGPEDDAEAALAEDLQHLVVPEMNSRLLVEGTCRP